MGIKYLWDTNTVIYYLQQQFPIDAEKFIDNVIRESQPCISAITEIELLCWKTAAEKDLVILHSFIQDALVLELDSAIKHKTAALRIQYKIKLPDAIIAATAIVYGLTLISRNQSDFNQIQELLVVDPHAI